MWLATQHMTAYVILDTRIWTILYFLYFIFLYLNYIVEYIVFDLKYKKN
jgi:hypothetical protein